MMTMMTMMMAMMTFSKPTTNSFLLLSAHLLPRTESSDDQVRKSLTVMIMMIMMIMVIVMMIVSQARARSGTA